MSNDPTTPHADHALEAAAQRIAAAVSDLDLDADLAATRATSPTTQIGAGDHVTPRPKARAAVLISVAAALVAVLAGVVVVNSRSSSDVIAPADTLDTAPPTTVADEPTPTATDPTVTPVTTVAAPATDAPDAGTDAGQTEAPACPWGINSSPEAANIMFVEQMLAVRADNGFVSGCVDGAPDAFDGTPPACWMPCPGVERTFQERSIRLGEFFSPPSTEPQYSGSIAVSYRTADGEFIDATEQWELALVEGEWSVSNFRVETSFIERDASAAVINEYFAAIESGDWAGAAAFLDDGALDLDQRQDLRRLDPSSFTEADIATALGAWCADGCDARRVEPGELFFDGGFRVVRRGHAIGASWFEGEYSVSGLPFRGDGSSGPETFTPDDLAAGVDLAIDGFGVTRATLFDPGPLSDEDRTALDSAAAAAGDYVPSSAFDGRFDEVLIWRADPWCSRRPTITIDRGQTGAGGTTILVSVNRPARLESAQPPVCDQSRPVAIGFELNDQVNASIVAASPTPIADATAVTTTPTGLVLDPHGWEFAATPLGIHPDGTARLVADTLVWHDEEGSDHIHVLTDTHQWMIEDEGRQLTLLDAGFVDERPVALITNNVANPVGPDDVDDRLQFVDVETGVVTDLGSAFGGWETGVLEARIIGDTIALLRFASTDMWIEIIDTQGTSLGTTPLLGDRNWSLAAQGSEVWAINVVSQEQWVTRRTLMTVVRFDVVTLSTSELSVEPTSATIDLTDFFCPHPEFFNSTLVCDVRGQPPVTVDAEGNGDVELLPGGTVGAAISLERV